MAGKVIDITAGDSVRIAYSDRPGSLQIPAAAVLAIDLVLRQMVEQDGSLSVEPVEDDATRETGWQADLDGAEYGGMAPTPWGAVISLAGRLERMLKENA